MKYVPITRRSKEEKLTQKEFISAGEEGFFLTKNSAFLSEDVAQWQKGGLKKTTKQNKKSLRRIRI